jgi:hypothetical protein
VEGKHQEGYYLGRHTTMHLVMAEVLYKYASQVDIPSILQDVPHSLVLPVPVRILGQYFNLTELKVVAHVHGVDVHRGDTKPQLLAKFDGHQCPTWCCRGDALNDFNCTREGGARLTTVILALCLPVASLIHNTPLCSALSFFDKFRSTPRTSARLGFVLGLQVQDSGLG